MKRPVDKDVPAYILKAMDTLEMTIVGNQNEAFDVLMKMTRGELYVLKMLLINEAPMNPSELTEKLGTTKGRVSSILKTLENKGEIIREVDRDNRRNTIVSITEVGEQRIMSELLKLRKHLISAFDKMGESDTTELARLLPRLFELLNHELSEDAS